MYKLKEVIIEITQRCNLNCFHCGSDCQLVQNNRELKIADWKKVVLELYEMGVQKIVYSGGEPTLKPGFAEILLYSSYLGIKTGFISNGFRPFDKTLQDAIAACQLFAIGLSIDGLKATHNQIRRNNNSWAALMKNISIIQGLETPICVVTTINKLNCSELPKMAALFNLMEIDSWQLQLAMPSGRMEEQREYLITESDFKTICAMIISLRENYPDLNIQSADCFGLAPPNSIRSSQWSGCQAGISMMAIDALGNVMPCLSLQGLTFENVRDKAISEIWKSSEGFVLNRCFEAKTVVGLCQNCDYLNDCRGGCNSQSLAYYDYFHSSPFCFYRSQTKK
jgi:radical SAM protein with 4Fe4S-binding SPASM domain